uniref:K Homology domain-containing protein n=1 Tax=Guillardia theta TaxID=55529 RepID=A0A6U6C2D0_GUITH|mmetsp:Transcript_43155/g.136454  ORF Transcript_43155/g.136454 Transcript_43155/m.136454 type:complete len:253 (+) Transcript_43155:62-820(+)
MQRAPLLCWILVLFLGSCLPDGTASTSARSRVMRLRGGGNSEDRSRRGLLSTAEIKAAERASIAKPAVINDEESGKMPRQTRAITVPPYRFPLLKRMWEDYARPIVQHLKLQIRLNLKRRVVEIRTCDFTTDASALTRAAEYTQAFMTGFSLQDATAMLRLDGLYMESFEITDIKRLKGDHLSRAIGRIAGTGGKTKELIEKSTRTRVVVADKKVHVMGSVDSIQHAKNVISDLVLGRLMFQLLGGSNVTQE